MNLLTYRLIVETIFMEDDRRRDGSESPAAEAECDECDDPTSIRELLTELHRLNRQQASYTAVLQSLNDRRSVVNDRLLQTLACSQRTCKKLRDASLVERDNELLRQRVDELTKARHLLSVLAFCWLRQKPVLLFLPRDAMLPRNLLSSCVCPSVCLSVCHKPVLYQNHWTGRTCFWHEGFLPPIPRCVLRKLGYLQK